MSRVRAWHVASALAIAALFAWNVRRSWFQSDDAFISFRYARHWAEGLGPVWNAGERVEGYTNFAWVALMAAGMRLGVAPELLSNVLGVLAGAALVAGVFRFEARGPASPWPWFLAALLAAHGSFTAWCTGGLETMAFALLVFLGYARLAAGGGERAALASGLLFAGAALTRPEGVLFGALGFAWLLADAAVRRSGARAALAWLAAFAPPVVAHFLWRRSYYGEWLPNTFYAKVAGAWWEQGGRYFRYFHDCYRIGWFLPLALLACLGPRRRTAVALALVLGAHAAYLLYVGGDVFELRFFVYTLPLLYWLLVEGLAVLAATRGRAGRVASAAGAAALAWTTLAGFDRVPGNHYGLQSIEGITQYTLRRIDEGRFLRERVETGTLPRELVLGCGGAGAVPYYTGWTTVDRRGLNDATIARLPVSTRTFVGHERDAPWEYLEQRGVVVFDYFNQLLVKERGLPQLRGPYLHDGREVRMRAIPLGGRALVFATFVDEETLRRTFPGRVILSLPLE